MIRFSSYKQAPVPSYASLNVELALNNSEFLTRINTPMSDTNSAAHLDFCQVKWQYLVNKIASISSKVGA